MSNDPGTVDITDLVNALESTFITLAVQVAYAAIIAVPGLQWLGLPVISSILNFSLNWIISLLANDAMLAAFFLNTAIVKASQAGDYIQAVENKNNLPPTATKEEYEQAEQAEISSFNALVIIS